MDSWVSDGQPHSIKELIGGHDYILLKQITWMKAYLKAQSIEFHLFLQKKKDETIV